MRTRTPAIGNAHADCARAAGARVPKKASKKRKTAKKAKKKTAKKRKAA